MKRKSMKRVITAAFTAILVLSFPGCGKEAPETSAIDTLPEYEQLKVSKKIRDRLVGLRETDTVNEIMIEITCNTGDVNDLMRDMRVGG